MADFTESLSDSVDITDTFSRQLSFSRAFTFASVGMTAAITRRAYKTIIFDSVNIIGLLRKNPRAAIVNNVGITAVLSYAGDLVQFDSWRPVAKPDNSLILICRTPLGEHDDYVGLTHLVLWTVLSDGTGERTAVSSPADNGYGWDSYAHPEWSPSGEDIVVAAETATEYEIVVLDATGFGS